MVKKSFDSHRWGPKKAAYYDEWKKFKEDKRLERLARNQSIIQKLFSTLSGR